MQKLKNYIAFTLAICLLFFLAVWWFNKNENIALADIRWQRPPTFLVLDNIKREKQTGLLFVRLKDGKEQFIAGKWNVVFSESGAYAYGAFPKGYSKDDGQHIYYLSGDGRIYHIQLEDSSKPITHIQESRDTNYLFIEVSRDNGRSYCVIPRINENKPSCQQLDVGSIADGLWNPAKDHELVIKTTSGQIFTFDPWEKKPNLLEKEDGVKYTNAIALFSGKPRTLNGKPKTIRILNVLFVKNEKAWKIVNVPPFAKIEWIHDWAHLLVVNRNNIKILEPFSQKSALIKQENMVIEHSIFLRSNGLDRELRSN